MFAVIGIRISFWIGPLGYCFPRGFALKNVLKNVIFLTKYAELMSLLKKARIYATNPHIHGKARKHQKGLQMNSLFHSHWLISVVSEQFEERFEELSSKMLLTASVSMS